MPFKITDFFFPGICPICGNRMNFTEIICESCSSNLYRFPIMRLNLNLKYVDSVWCYGRYEDLLSDAIKTYKYGHVLSIHRIFVEQMVDLLRRSSIDLKQIVLTSVPPTTTSWLSKGFDHTGIIAKGISRAIGMRYEPLLKARDKEPQVNLKEKDRKKNVLGKYKIRRKNADIPKKVLIFDDVITTGSTLKECGRVLKENGVSEVHGLVLACSLT